jgi:hypothetical protein
MEPASPVVDKRELHAVRPRPRLVPDDVLNAEQAGDTLDVEVDGHGFARAPPKRIPHFANPEVIGWPSLAQVTGPTSPSWLMPCMAWYRSTSR